MSSPRWFQPAIPYLGLIAALLLLIIFFGVKSDHFLEMSTLRTIANQTPELTFLAIGMTWVLLIRGIDLSVGSLLALGAAVIGVLIVKADWSVTTAILAAIAVTASCGAISGFISELLCIPSFIVTLGMLEIGRGVTKLLTNSQSIYIGQKIEWFGEPLPACGVSPAFVAALTAVFVGQLLLSRTVFGRYCVAIGTNAEVVRMSGIRTSPYVICVFVVSGLMCALGAWAQLGRMPTTDPNTAIGIELAAIAACVIGGTSLMGGRATVIGTFLGVLIIQILQTGLAQIGVSDAKKQIVTGAVIIVAVALDALRTRWNKSSS